MSWSLHAVGPKDHLQEYVRRHCHHYLRDTDPGERALINHVVGHALRQADDGRLYDLSANGHADADQYAVSVSVWAVRPTDLPPAIPDGEDSEN